MNDITDIELEYNARVAIPDHERFSNGWEERSRAYRGQADADLDIAYGPARRMAYDFFRCDGADGSEPLAAYIHGGYWRSRGREDFAHVARALNALGVSVAIPSYDHCPDVSVMEIIGQMRTFLAKLWERTQRHPVVAGHSAGAHLTACMLATDWSAIEGVPDDLVRFAYGISGIYDLTPLPQVSVTEDLKLTEQSAREASPLFWPAPAAGTPYVAAVGGIESNAFRQQSRALAEAWAGAGVAAEYVEIPDCHHFSVVDAFTAPGSPMADRVAQMAQQAAEG